MFVMTAVFQTVELIDHCEAGICAVVIHAADIDQVVKPEVAFGEGADFGNLIGVCRSEGDFTPELGRTRETVTEFPDKLIG